MIVTYATKRKKTDFPITPLYNCFYVKDDEKKFVNPITDVYGKEINIEDIAKLFEYSSSDEIEKTKFISTFMEPLKYELKDFDA